MRMRHGMSSIIAVWSGILRFFSHATQHLTELFPARKTRDARHSLCKREQLALEVLEARQLLAATILDAQLSSSSTSLGLDFAIQVGSSQYAALDLTAAGLNGFDCGKVVVTNNTTKETYTLADQAGNDTKGLLYLKNGNYTLTVAGANNSPAKAQVKLEYKDSQVNTGGGSSALKTLQEAADLQQQIAAGKAPAAAWNYFVTQNKSKVEAVYGAGALNGNVIQKWGSTIDVNGDGKFDTTDYSIAQQIAVAAGNPVTASVPLANVTANSGTQITSVNTGSSTNSSAANALPTFNINAGILNATQANPSQTWNVSALATDANNDTLTITEIVYGSTKIARGATVNVGNNVTVFLASDGKNFTITSNDINRTSDVSLPLTVTVSDGKGQTTGNFTASIKAGLIINSSPSGTIAVAEKADGYIDAKTATYTVLDAGTQTNNYTANWSFAATGSAGVSVPTNLNSFFNISQNGTVTLNSTNAFAFLRSSETLTITGTLQVTSSGKTKSTTFTWQITGLGVDTTWTPDSNLSTNSILGNRNPTPTIALGKITQTPQTANVNWSIAQSSGNTFTDFTPTIDANGNVSITLNSLPPEGEMPIKLFITATDANDNSVILATREVEFTLTVRAPLEIEFDSTNGIKAPTAPTEKIEFVITEATPQEIGTIIDPNTLPATSYTVTPSVTVVAVPDRLKDFDFANCFKVNGNTLTFDPSSFFGLLQDGEQVTLNVTFTVSDKWTTSAATAAVTFIAKENSPPILATPGAGGTASLIASTPDAIFIDVSDILSFWAHGDTAEAENISQWTITLTSGEVMLGGAKIGTATIEDNKIVFAPDDITWWESLTCGDPQTLTFIYTVKDSHGDESAEATFTLIITPAHEKIEFSLAADAQTEWTLYLPEGKTDSLTIAPEYVYVCVPTRDNENITYSVTVTSAVDTDGKAIDNLTNIAWDEIISIDSEGKITFKRDDVNKALDNLGTLTLSVIVKCNTCDKESNSIALNLIFTHGSFSLKDASGAGIETDENITVELADTITDYLDDRGDDNQITWDSLITLDSVTIGESEWEGNLEDLAEYFSINENGIFTFTPNKKFDFLAAGETATLTFTLTASDGETDISSTLIIKITGISEPKLTVTVAPESVTESKPAVITFTTEDPNGHDNQIDVKYSVEGTLNKDASEASKADLELLLQNNDFASFFTIDEESGTLTFNPDGAFDFLCAGDKLTFTVTFTAKDEATGLSSDPQTVTFTVTGEATAPVAKTVDPVEVNPGTESIFENFYDLIGTNIDAGAAFVVSGMTVTLGETSCDVEFVKNGDDWTATITDSETGKTISVFTYTAASGGGVDNLTFTPDADYFATLTPTMEPQALIVSFKIKGDNVADTVDSAAVTFNVVGVSEPPKISDDIIVSEDVTESSSDATITFTVSDQNGRDVAALQTTHSVVDDDGLLGMTQDKLNELFSLTSDEDGNYTLTFIPGNNFMFLRENDTLTLSVTITVEDSMTGLTTTEIVTFIVTGEKSAPMAGELEDFFTEVTSGSSATVENFYEKLGTNIDAGSAFVVSGMTVTLDDNECVVDFVQTEDSDDWTATITDSEGKTIGVFTYTAASGGGVDKLTFEPNADYFAKLTAEKNDKQSFTVSFTIQGNNETDPVVVDAVTFDVIGVSVNPVITNIEIPTNVTELTDTAEITFSVSDPNPSSGALKTTYSVDATLDSENQASQDALAALMASLGDFTSFFALENGKITFNPGTSFLFLRDGEILTFTVTLKVTDDKTELSETKDVTFTVNGVASKPVAETTLEGFFESVTSGSSETFEDFYKSLGESVDADSAFFVSGMTVKLDGKDCVVTFDDVPTTANADWTATITIAGQTVGKFTYTAATADGGGDTLKFEPDAGYFVTLESTKTQTFAVSFQITGDNGEAAENATNVEFNVIGVSVKPTISVTNPSVVNESATAETTVTVTDSNACNCTLTPTIASVTATLTGSAASQTALTNLGALASFFKLENGTLTFDPNGKFDFLCNGDVLTFTVTLTATDSVTNLTSDATPVTFTVSGVASAPKPGTVALVNNQSVTVGQNVVIGKNWQAKLGTNVDAGSSFKVSQMSLTIGDTTYTAVEPAYDKKNWSATFKDSNGQEIGVFSYTNSGTGDFTFIPNADFFADLKEGDPRELTISFQIKSDNGTAAVPTASAKFNVVGISKVPSIVVGSATVTTNESEVKTVDFTVTDPNGRGVGEGETTISLVVAQTSVNSEISGVNLASLFAVTNKSNGQNTLTFTPDKKLDALKTELTITVTITVTDETTKLQTAQDVTFTITPSKPTLVTLHGTATMDSDEANLTIGSVLNNWTHLNQTELGKTESWVVAPADSGNVYAMIGGTSTLIGTASFDDGTITFTPTEGGAISLLKCGETLTFEISYTVADSRAIASSVATISVTVIGVHDKDIEVTLKEDTQDSWTFHTNDPDLGEDITVFTATPVYKIDGNNVGAYYALGTVAATGTSITDWSSIIFVDRETGEVTIDRATFAALGLGNDVELTVQILATCPGNHDEGYEKVIGNVALTFSISKFDSFAVGNSSGLTDAETSTGITLDYFTTDGLLTDNAEREDFSWAAFDVTFDSITGDVDSEADWATILDKCFSIKNGVFTFTPSGKFDFLAVNQSAVLTFTVTVKDKTYDVEHTATLTVTITGEVSAPKVNTNIGVLGTVAYGSAQTWTGIGAKLGTTVDQNGKFVLHAISVDDGKTFVTLVSGVPTAFGDIGTFTYDSANDKLTFTPGTKFAEISAPDNDPDTEDDFIKFPIQFQLRNEADAGATKLSAGDISIVVTGVNTPPVGIEKIVKEVIAGDTLTIIARNDGNNGGIANDINRKDTLTFVEVNTKVFNGSQVITLSASDLKFWIDTNGNVVIDTSLWAAKLKPYDAHDGDTYIKIGLDFIIEDNHDGSTNSFMITLFIKGAPASQTQSLTFVPSDDETSDGENSPENNLPMQMMSAPNIGENFGEENSSDETPLETNSPTTSSPKNFSAPEQFAPDQNDDDADDNRRVWQPLADCAGLRFGITEPSRSLAGGFGYAELKLPDNANEAADKTADDNLTSESPSAHPRHGKRADAYFAHGNNHDDDNWFLNESRRKRSYAAAPPTKANHSRLTDEFFKTF